MTALRHSAEDLQSLQTARPKCRKLGSELCCWLAHRKCKGIEHRCRLPICFSVQQRCQRKRVVIAASAGS